MEKELVLKENGKVVSKGREFTRLIGGFGEDKPAITTKQISDLIGYDNSIINRTINRNIKHFGKGVDIIDLKNKRDIFVEEIGYSKNAYNASKKIYLLSHEGFLKYLQMAEIKEDYTDFEKQYFGSNNLKISTVRYEHCFEKILRNSFKDICNFQTQYNCNGYRIDFYEEKYKLAIEYDEGQHFVNNNLREEDIKRQNEIEKELACYFIRVTKGEEIQGINEIIKYIMTH